MKFNLFYAFLIGVLPFADITLAQDSPDVDGDTRSSTEVSSTSSQQPPKDSPTVHTSQSGVVTQISVVNPTDIDPFSESKKLSEWLDQFCHAVSVLQNTRGSQATFRSNALIDEAREAILDMGESAVPYLVSQLRIDPTGQVENQLRQMRNSAWSNSVTLDYLDSIVLPSTRRGGAAQLLGGIGAPAKEALPLLVKLWSQHSEYHRTPYFIGVRKILYDMSPRPELVYPKEFSHWSERLAFETNVVAAAIEHCPQLPDDLKSQFDHLLKPVE